jgi:hypothetical protein
MNPIVIGDLSFDPNAIDSVGYELTGGGWGCISIMLTSGEIQKVHIRPEGETDDKAVWKKLDEMCSKISEEVWRAHRGGRSRTTREKCQAEIRKMSCVRVGDSFFRTDAIVSVGFEMDSDGGAIWVCTSDGRVRKNYTAHKTGDELADCCFEIMDRVAKARAK